MTNTMTYEEYMDTPEEMRRYDILDGIQVYRLYGPEENRLPNPTIAHQDIVMNLAMAFRVFEKRERLGQFIIPPCDVLIKRHPLHTRQPDLLFMSNERLAANPPPTDPSPLNPAPELVVEIVWPADRPGILAAKISDYHFVDVREVWVVRPDEQMVEVIRVTLDEIETVAAYGSGETVTSLAFPGLTVAVDAVFAE